MNPEENNPTAANGATEGASTPAAIDFTANAVGGTEGGLSMADSLASAEDNLTSAGLAAKGAESDAIGLDQIGASDPSATMARPDEPLIPAAPVPGSLGSAISGPALPEVQEGTTAEASATPTVEPAAAGAAGAAAPVADVAVPAADAAGATAPMTNPAAAAAPSATAADGMTFVAASETVTEVTPEAAPVDVAAAMTPAPEAATPSATAANMTTDAMAASAAAEVPPAKPFNPFAPDAAPMSSAAGTVNPFDTASSANVPAGLQPKTERFSTKGKNGAGKSHLTMILGILAAIGIVAAIVFAVLWQMALANGKKVVYITQTPPAEEIPEPEDVSVTCTRTLGPESAVEGLVNFMGAEVSVQLDFTNDALTKMNTLTAYDLFDAVSVEMSRATLDEMAAAVNMAAALLETETPAMAASYETADKMVNYRIVIDVDQLKDTYPEALTSLPKNEDGSVALNEDAVVPYLEANGYTCAEVE